MSLTIVNRLTFVNKNMLQDFTKEERKHWYCGVKKAYTSRPLKLHKLIQPIYCFPCNHLHRSGINIRSRHTRKYAFVWDR